MFVNIMSSSLSLWTSFQWQNKKYCLQRTWNTLKIRCEYSFFFPPSSYWMYWYRIWRKQIFTTDLQARSLLTHTCVRTVETPCWTSTWTLCRTYIIFSITVLEILFVWTCTLSLHGQILPQLTIQWAHTYTPSLSAS